jgi:hypothetical protein
MCQLGYAGMHFAFLSNQARALFARPNQWIANGVHGLTVARCHDSREYKVTESESNSLEYLL